MSACKTKIYKAPTIILMMTDDQVYGDVSAHNNPDVLTPNVDQLKSQAVSLDDFQATILNQMGITHERIKFRHAVSTKEEGID